MSGLLSSLRLFLQTGSKQLIRSLHTWCGTIVTSSPLTLSELVVGLVLVVGVEVEDALDEVLAEHLRVLLQQQVKEAVLTQSEAHRKSRMLLIL